MDPGFEASRGSWSAEGYQPSTDNKIGRLPLLTGNPSTASYLFHHTSLFGYREKEQGERRTSRMNFIFNARLT